MYVNIVRGALSGDDLSLIALNGAVEPGYGLKGMIETYGLLKHLARSEREPFLQQCFEPSAFLGMTDRLH